MKNKIVVITGANSGIGKQTAIELAREGATVVMVCRNRERGEEARQAIIKESGNEHILLEICDLSRMESIRGCGELMYEKYKRIDVLINNAGAIFGNYQLTKEGMEQTFALNHMGYFLLTHYLLDAVKRGNDKRIINVASLAHKFVREIPWDDLQLEHQKYGQMKAYGLSKLYNIYFTRYLAQKLEQEQTQVTVNCLHPGTVYTGFGQSGGLFFSKLIQIAKPFLKKPKKGAETSVFLATSSTVSTTTGAYFDNKKEATITKLAQSKENAYKLWQVSMDIAAIETYGNVVVRERK